MAALGCILLFLDGSILFREVHFFEPVGRLDCKIEGFPGRVWRRTKSESGSVVFEEQPALTTVP